MTTPSTNYLTNYLTNCSGADTVQYTYVLPRQPGDIAKIVFSALFAVATAMALVAGGLALAGVFTLIASPLFLPITAAIALGCFILSVALGASTNPLVTETDTFHKETLEALQEKHPEELHE